MRICSAPSCGKEITACMGTVKAGDFLEAVLGMRTWKDVRELCPTCATRSILRCDRGEKLENLLPELGWT
jgi:predicted RNA-binding Zn-ribbon protein involved in translation (DUF1610 family)